MGGIRLWVVVGVTALLLIGCAPDKKTGLDIGVSECVSGDCSVNQEEPGDEPVSFDPDGPGDLDWDLLDSDTDLRLDDLAPEAKLAAPLLDDSRSKSSLSAAALPIVEDSSGIFADSVLGDDANPGTMAAPVVSLQRAVNYAEREGKAVFVAGGSGRTYDAFWAHEEVYCGYSPDFSVRDPQLYPSVISGGAERRWGVAIGKDRSALLDGCVIKGGDASWEATLGVIAWGPTVLRYNLIDGGDGYLRSHGVGHARLCTGKLEMIANVVEVKSASNLAAGGVVNGGCDAALVNNTIVVRSPANYGRAYTSWNTSLSSLLLNNIFDSSGAASNRGVEVIGGSKVRLINNLITGSGARPDAHVFGYTGTGDFQRLTGEAQINDCASWVGYCVEASENIVEIAGNYADASNSNYHLMTIDSAVDAGTDATALGFANAVTDIEGRPRPLGAEWDCGAYEYDELDLNGNTKRQYPYGPDCDDDGDGKFQYVCGGTDFDDTDESIYLQQGNGNYMGYTTVDNGARLVASLVVADFNKDGWDDIATVNDDIPEEMSVILNNGDGTFAKFFVNVNGGGSASVVAADFDYDGDLDLATANKTSGNVSILLNNGSGMYSAGVTISVGDAPDFILTNDFNGDGVMDLLTTNKGSFDISILMNDGNGSFNLERNILADHFGDFMLAAADFDGDGDIDLVTEGYWRYEDWHIYCYFDYYGYESCFPYYNLYEGDSLFLYDNLGYGSFEVVNKQTFGNYYDYSGLSYKLLPANLDEDGLIDIAAGSKGYGMTYCAYNNSDETFTLGNQNWEHSVDNIMVADFNGNGHVDMIYFGHQDYNKFIPLINAGGGSFSSGAAIPISTISLYDKPSNAYGDFNNDGALDLLVARDGIEIIWGNP